MSASITDDELSRLKTAVTESEWNAVCKDIKAARSGRFPHDWTERVMLPGVMAAALRRFRPAGPQIR